MKRTANTDWLQLAHDSYWLWADSMVVMGMRTTDMMTGRGTAQESALMITEKLQAAGELGMKLATAGVQAPEQSVHTAVRHYRKHVTANRKRLTKASHSS